MYPLNRRPMIEQNDPPRSPREILPTMYDLPSEDPEEPGLPDEFHDLQPQLLSRTLRLSSYPSDRYFTASDLNVYYDINHPLWQKRPDWFLAVNVPRLYDGKDLRRSYVVWQEGNHLKVVVEFLSPGTEAEDLGRFYQSRSERSPEPPAGLPPSPEDSAAQNGTEAPTKPPGKFEIYEQYLCVPHYLVYDRLTRTLRYFQLQGGQYEEQTLNSEPPLAWLASLEIGLGIWEGTFAGVPGHWLRWCDRQGNWFPTDTEQALAAAEQAQAQLFQAARNLLATGMPIEQVQQILELTDAQRQILQNSL